MAAYAAAVSLMHTLDLLNNHPSPPISLDKKQLHSLTEIVTFFQEFLEGYVSPFSYSDEADPLEMRIAEAIYAAEDVIESYIVGNIHLAAAAAATTEHDDDDVNNIHLAAAVAAQDEDEPTRYINFYEGLQKAIEAMDLIKKETIEMETGREKGGLGVELQRKVSTEAGSIPNSIESNKEMVGFEDEILELKERLVGGYSRREIISIVGTGGIGKTTLARNVFTNQLIKEHFDICLWATISQDYNIEHTLSEVLSQAKLNSIMDDMWSLEVWDKMRCFFPDCNKRSRVIVTTRMSDLASHLTNSNNTFCMSFLNEVDSWNLFSKTVFGSEGIDPVLEFELREIGERIVGKCKGLPLSIAVIGGLLATSERTQGYWEYVENNLNSIVNLENEEYCLRVLKLSYNHLPAYLKPCFLYMGVFEEDSKIKVSKIIHLWVSEGFLKPKKGKKNLEIVAREYLQELVDRNLVLAHELKSSKFLMGGREFGLVEKYKMHDLVRDVCLREAQKQRFYYVHNSKEHSPPSRHDSHRRIVIANQTHGSHVPQITLELSSNPRSCVCHGYYAHLFSDFRLLRTLDTHCRASVLNCHAYRQKDVLGLVNARLLAVDLAEETEDYCLPPPPNNDNNNIVILENLQTLVGMKDFHLNEDVVRRMPNLTTFDWEDVLEKIGWLPLVEELAIESGVFRSRIWETIEGQFLRLKSLKLASCSGLQKWTVSEASSHFHHLENLLLDNLGELEEIPLEIGEIATLKSIKLNYCSESAVLSAKRIVQEQEKLYGEEELLPFRVEVKEYNKAWWESLASPKFQLV
ncbi:hypothetical protein OROMI_010486 [Orobanche minor]